MPIQELRPQKKPRKKEREGRKMENTNTETIREVTPEELRDMIRNLPEGTMIIVENGNPEANDGQEE